MKILSTLSRSWLPILLVLDGCWLLIELVPPLREVVASLFSGLLLHLDLRLWTTVTWIKAFSVLLVTLLLIRFVPEFASMIQASSKPRRSLQYQPRKQKEKTGEIDVGLKLRLGIERARREKWRH